MASRFSSLAHSVAYDRACWARRSVLAAARAYSKVGGLSASEPPEILKTSENEASSKLQTANPSIGTATQFEVLTAFSVVL